MTIKVSTAADLRPIPGFRNDASAVFRGSEVQLTESLVYISRAGRLFVVPAGLVSDLESRPTLLPGFVNALLGTILSTARASLLHDFLYDEGPYLRPPVTRHAADALYREALLITVADALPRGTPVTRRARARRVVGAAVARTGLFLGGWRAWRKHRRLDAEAGGRGVRSWS